ncbi:hypothetical protein AB4K05_07100 [Kluyvera sp. STS39-E]|uniref:hypothetical protein n=1 Tax=Kluyvera sp. STS39-E TaxID=3234748 RepID=UPI0034C679AA
MLNIDYAEGLNVPAKISIGSIDDLDCTLIIARNSFPHLKMGDYFFSNEVDAFLNNPPNLISLKSQRETFTLYNSERTGDSLIPEYVTTGSKPENINGVDISLSGLYTFFDGRSNFTVSDSCIKKDITDCFIKTEFNINGELYTFSVEHDYSFSKKIDTTTIVEDAFIRIRKSEGDVSLDAIKCIIKKTRILFSLMLGFDLSIRKTWLIKNDGARCNSLYFHAPSKLEHPFENSHDCFIFPAQLLTNDEWNKILTSTFNGDSSSTLSEFWVRLVSMFSYKGFWEYEILGVVSLLDAYSKKHHETHTNKTISLRKFDKLKDSIKNTLREYKKSLPADKKHTDSCEVIDNMILQVGYIKNTNAQDFRLILKLLMETISVDIQNLISFKDEDFETIIKIRNAAAHGAPIDEEIMANLQRVMIVKEKIKFLLLYLFFKSMSFSDKDFIKLCRHSFSKIKFGAALDSYTLNMMSGTGIALNIDNEDIAKAKKTSKVNTVIIHHVKSQKCEIGNNTIQEIMDSMYSSNKGKFINFVDLIYANYLIDEIFSVQYASSLFLCAEDVKIELHGAYLIQIND